MVTIDFSEHTTHALEVAAKITKQQKTNITLLHMHGLSEAIQTNDKSQEYQFPILKFRNS